MPRYDRPKFDLCEMRRLPPEARARLMFDWWCDEEDREAFLRRRRGRTTLLRSRSHVQDDPAPPRNRPPAQGRSLVALISDPDAVAHALTDSATYGNIPYAELGGASFMLALDPGASVAPDGTDWHTEQRRVAKQILGRFSPAQLAGAAHRAVEQAAIVGLAAPAFDLADFAQQAALRYFALVFGYGSRDHVLLEEAARRGYRALQYLIVGRHFASEPGTIPAAQEALARLAARSDALIHEYFTLRRAPRRAWQPGKVSPADRWPTGVQPWDELGLSGLGDPVLRTLPGDAGALSGQDLCTLLGGLLVGMVGNVQTAVCLMVEALFQARDGDTVDAWRELQRCELHAPVRRLMARRPAVPFLPRRVLKGVKVRGVRIAPGTECILALRPGADAGCPWGEGEQGKGIHACLGRAFVEPLLEELMHRVVHLPDLEQALDDVTGEVVAPERLWGFGCTRYPLRYRRDRQRVQQPLIVVMPVKAPIAENAQRLRLIIHSAAPRIEHVLRDSAFVHVAWFEFLEADTQLALHTVYDGDFDAYILHFAEKAGELFDQLFQCIEGAPRMPVAEHPYEFVETVRRFNRTPLGGFFYSAYPRHKVPDILAGAHRPVATQPPCGHAEANAAPPACPRSRT